MNKIDWKEFWHAPSHTVLMAFLHYNLIPIRSNEIGCLTYKIDLDLCFGSTNQNIFF